MNRAPQTGVFVKPDVLRRLIADHGFSHGRLARVLGVSVPLVNKWLDRTRSVSRDDRRALLVLFRVPFDELFDLLVDGEPVGAGLRR